MGKHTGYLDYDRKDPGYRKVEERVKDFDAVEKSLPLDDLREQAARCMDCGTPFCFSKGCPLGNVVPEFNDMVSRGQWKDALTLLLETNCFPEFTAAVCPAPCEAACVLNINDNPVTIRQIERKIVDMGFQKGYIKPEPPSKRIGRQVAVIGSGPAGLATAHYLNRAGCDVTVFEKAENVGGLLRYGIPDFKLEKRILDRRLELMRNEGIAFETNTAIGEDLSCDYLIRRFDAVCLTGGSRQPRDMDVPGRELDGIHFAMDFLVQQNKVLAGEPIENELISARGKRVVVIGGGDTGSDCVGTALRQGAEKVYQFEIMPQPPLERESENPWPDWPNILRESSSQQEGGERRWSVNTRKFSGNEDGRVAKIHCNEFEWKREGGQMRCEPKPESDFEVDVDLVLLAMGFVGPAENEIIDNMRLKKDAKGNLWTNEQHMTSIEGVFSAGDMRSGQSLVVQAIMDGRQAANDILAYLAS